MPRALALAFLSMALTVLGSHSLWLMCAASGLPQSENKLTSEQPVALPRERAAVGTQSSFDVASDGHGYLFVWSNLEGGAWAVPVDSDGTVNDRCRVRLQNLESFVSVIWTGQWYFVIGNDGLGNIRGIRVNSGGELLDHTARILAPQAFTSAPGLASNGSHILLLYRKGENSFASLHRSDGELIRSEALPADRTSSSFVTASDGTGFVVFWPEAGALRAARIDSQGLIATVVSVSGVQLVAGQMSIATDGRRCLIAWVDGVYSHRSIRAALVDVLDLIAEKTMMVADGLGFVSETDVIWDGVNFQVLWDASANPSGPTGFDVYLRRVSSSGDFLESAPVPVMRTANTQWFPRAASDGHTLLAVWSDDRASLPGRNDVYGILLDSGGSPVSADTPPGGFPIARSATEQDAPAAVSDRTGFVLVWEEVLDDLDQSVLLGARFRGDGSAVFQQPISISDVGYQFSPAVAFDGTAYLVTWSHATAWNGPWTLLGRRFDSSGRNLDNEPFPIAQGVCAFRPNIGFDGTNYLVVWSDCSGIHGRGISSNGEILDSVSFSLTDLPYAGSPRIAWSGSSFLVTWYQGDSCAWGPPRESCSSLRDVYSARVSSAGSLLDSLPLPVSTGENDQIQPSVAFDGRDFLIVYSESHWSFGSTIMAKRVSTSGSLLDGPSSAPGISISSAGRSVKSSPVVSVNGPRLLVAWQDYRGRNDSGYPQPDVYASQLRNPIDLSGSAQEFPIASSSSHERDPAAAALIGARTAVIYERVAPEDPYGGATRVFFRLYSSLSRHRPVAR